MEFPIYLPAGDAVQIFKIRKERNLPTRTVFTADSTQAAQAHVSSGW